MMHPSTIQKNLRAVVILLGLSLCTVLPVSAAPTPVPSASPSASPAAKAHPFPYQGVIVSVDKTARTLRIGKNTIHHIHVLPESKLSKDEKPAAFETLAAGMEVRCSVRKRADADWDAVSIKIGAKPTPTPAQPQR